MSLGIVADDVVWSGRNGVGPTVIVGYASRSTLREWRNGRRASFRCWCPQGRGGSSPPSRTTTGSPWPGRLAYRREALSVRGVRHVAMGSADRPDILDAVSSAPTIVTGGDHQHHRDVTAIEPLTEPSSMVTAV